MSFKKHVISSLVSLAVVGGFLAMAGTAFATAPAITGISPATATTAGLGSMTITGTNFTVSSVYVYIGGPVASSSATITSSSTTQLIVTIPATTTPGAAWVRVTTADGTDATSTLFTYISVPKITDVAPATTTVAGGSIVITGTQFQSTITTVTIGGASAPITASSTTSLTVTAPATTTPGLSPIVVTNSDGGTVSTSTAFRYISVPTITNVTPSATTTAGGTVVTITGTQFKSTTTAVTIGGASATVTASSETSLTVTAPATSTPGLTPIVVTNSDGGVVSTSTALRYIAPATSVSLGAANSFAILAYAGITDVPTSAITGNIGVSPTTGASITGFGCPEITGTVYTVDAAGPACRMINTSLLTTAMTNEQTAYTTANAEPTGVLNAGDGAGEIGSLTLIPGVYKFTGGSANVTISTNLTLNGTSTEVWVFQIPGTLDLATGIHVNLTGGAVPENVFWVVAGQTTLHASSILNGNILDYAGIAMQAGATLNGRAMSHTASVTLISDIITAPASFPTFTSITPNSDTTLGGTSISIVGTGFATSSLASTTVTIGGVSATSIVVLSDTHITAITPVGASTGHANVIITNPDTGSVSSSTAFTYTAINHRSSIVYVNHVSLNENSRTLTVGNTDQLIAAITPTDATNKNVTWSSNNTGAATVSNLGLITAVGAGTAAITVTTADGSFTATDVVTVVAASTSGGSVSTSPSIVTTTPTTVPATTITTNPTVSAVSGGYNFVNDLTVGSKGTEVTELQKVLVSDGYLTMPAGTTYGNFGSLTKTALIKYQKARGITPASGNFGPITRQSINSSNTTSSSSNIPASQNVASMTLKQLIQMLLQIGAISSDKIDAANKLVNTLQ